jgi:two-component system cell cycle sensor histidine kinase/response regulator CckA
MATGMETVLLVDDEEIVIGVGRQMLERLGYSVLTAKNGLEAVDVYRDNQNAIGLIILDMIMPGLEAGDTYDRLRALNPDIKVLLSSGYGLDQKIKGFLERGCSGFIQKPFNMKILEDKIEEVMAPH